MEKNFDNDEKLINDNLFDYNNEQNSYNIDSEDEGISSTGSKTRNNYYVNRGDKKNIINNNKDMDTNKIIEDFKSHGPDFFNKSIEKTESDFYIQSRFDINNEKNINDNNNSREKNIENINNNDINFNDINCFDLKKKHLKKKTEK